MKNKKQQQSQVEHGPEVPNYALLNEAKKHQKAVASATVVKQRTSKTRVKPDATKPQ